MQLLTCLWRLSVRLALDEPSWEFNGVGTLIPCAPLGAAQADAPPHDLAASGD